MWFDYSSLSSHPLLMQTPLLYLNGTSVACYVCMPPSDVSMCVCVRACVCVCAFVRACMCACFCNM